MFSKFFTPWKSLIVTALILRFFSASFLFHTDLKENYVASTYLNQGISAGYALGLNENKPLHYPPPIFLIYNSHQNAFSFLFSDYFPTWLGDGSALHTINHPSLFRDLLAMKLPSLLAEIILVFFLIKSLPQSKRFTAAWVWLLNPLVIYAIYGISNFDIFPAAFLALGIWGWQRHKPLTYLALGIAASFKLFPLLLLPGVFLLDNRSVLKRLRDLLLAILPLLISLLPLHNDLPAVKTLLFSNMTTGTFTAILDLGKGSIPLTAIALSLLYLYIWSTRHTLNIISFQIIALLAIFSLSHFHPQWIIWVLPALTHALVTRNLAPRLFIAFCFAYVGYVLLFNDKFTSLGLLKGINNIFDTGTITIRQLLDRVNLGELAQGFMHAVFIAAAVLITKNFFSPSRFNPLTLTHKHVFYLWGTTLVLIFAFSHILISRTGYSFDTVADAQQRRLVLSSTTTITQSFTPQYNHLGRIELRLKNINHQFQSELHLQISDSEQIIHQTTVPGAQIGDDFNLDIKFPTIPNSSNQTYFLTLQAPDTQAGTELVIPYDETSQGMTVDNQPFPGRLSYILYQKQSNPLILAAQSLRTMATKW